MSGCSSRTRIAGSSRRGTSGRHPKRPRGSGGTSAGAWARRRAASLGRPAPPRARRVARGAAHEHDRRRSHERRNGGRGESRRGRRDLGVPACRRSGALPRGPRARAAGDRLLSVRGGGGCGVRQPDATRAARAAGRARDQGGDARFSRHLPADRGSDARPPRQAAHHGRGSLLGVFAHHGGAGGAGWYGRGAHGPAERAARIVPCRELCTIRPAVGPVRPVRRGDLHSPHGGIRAPHAVGPGGRRRDPTRCLRRPVGTEPAARGAGRGAPGRARGAGRARRPAVKRVPRRSFLEACAAGAALPLFKGFVPMKQKPHVLGAGAGAFGGWTALYLRRGGARVTLVDAWGPGNARASSGGETRVIRATYGPRAVYTHMAVRALALWREHERGGEQRLLPPIGGLWLRGGGGTYQKGARAPAPEGRGVSPG